MINVNLINIIIYCESKSKPENRRKVGATQNDPKAITLRKRVITATWIYTYTTMSAGARGVAGGFLYIIMQIKGPVEAGQVTLNCTRAVVDTSARMTTTITAGVNVIYVDVIYVDVIYVDSFANLF